jgi:hypothetical protein
VLAVISIADIYVVISRSFIKPHIGAQKASPRQCARVVNGLDLNLRIQSSNGFGGTSLAREHACVNFEMCPTVAPPISLLPDLPFSGVLSMWTTEVIVDTIYRFFIVVHIGAL